MQRQSGRAQRAGPWSAGLGAPGSPSRSSSRSRRRARHDGRRRDRGARPRGRHREPPTARRPIALPWAELLLRVFREDVLLCPCGGRRVVLAFVTEKKIVKEILEHLGLPTTGPPVAPARIAAACEDAPWQDDLPELQQTLR